MLARATRAELWWRLRSGQTLGSAFSLSVMVVMLGVLWRFPGTGRELAVASGLAIWMCLAVSIGVPLRRNTAAQSLGVEHDNTQARDDWILPAVPATDLHRVTAVLLAMGVFCAVYSTMIFVVAAWVFEPVFRALLASFSNILSALLCAGAGLEFGLRNPDRARLGGLWMAFVGAFTMMLGGPPITVAVAVWLANRSALGLPATNRWQGLKIGARRPARLVSARRLGGRTRMRYDLLRSIIPNQWWHALELLVLAAVLGGSFYVFRHDLFPGFVLVIAVLFATHTELGFPNTTVGVHGSSDAGLGEACAALPVAPWLLARACLAHGLIRSIYLGGCAVVVLAFGWPDVLDIAGAGHALVTFAVFGLSALISSGARVLHRFRSASCSRAQFIFQPALTMPGIVIFTPQAEEWRIEGMASLSLVLLLLPLAAVFVGVRLRPLLRAPSG